MITLLDLETTGLDPVHDSILEVGIIVVSDSLEEVARASWTCMWRRERKSLPQAVRQMHEASGLLDECSRQNVPLPSEVESRALAFLRETCGAAAAKTMPMCGNTISFDRAFLRHKMRELHDWFHYRNIDVSTLNELARRWFPEVWEKRPCADEKQKPHRTLPDLENSIAQLRYYRSEMFKGA